MQRISRETAILAGKLCFRAGQSASPESKINGTAVPTSVVFWLAQLESMSRRIHHHAELACNRELRDSEVASQERRIKTVKSVVVELNRMSGGYIVAFEILTDPRAGCGISLTLADGASNSFDGETWRV